jgi:hypothetical protein
LWNHLNWSAAFDDLAQAVKGRAHRWRFTNEVILERKTATGMRRVFASQSGRRTRGIATYVCAGVTISTARG